MERSLVSIVALIFAMAVQAQTLNTVDSEGRRDGRWILLLDKDWKHTSDSSKARYARYTYYDHGVHIYPMGACGGKGYRLEPADARQGINLLDGEYKWYDGKGRLSSVHVFSNGEYLSCKEYYRTGELEQHFDFTKKCEGEQHGWTVYLHHKDGSLRATHLTCRNKAGKWPLMRG